MPEETERWEVVPWKFLLWTGGTLVALVAVIQLMSVPPYPKERSWRLMCESHLREVALACRLYSQDNDGRMPDALEHLLPAQLDDRKLLKCRRDKSAAPSSYALVPGLRAGMPGDFVLVYETSLQNHKGVGRNVAFLDTRAEWWPAARDQELRKLLAEQAEKARNWKPPATATEPPRRQEGG